MKKNNNIELFGAIGYTYLKNNINEIIVFSDMHDKLPECKNNYMEFKDFLISKFNKSKIFLEEIPSLSYDNIIQNKESVFNNKDKKKIDSIKKKIIKSYKDLDIKIEELWSASKHVKDIQKLYFDNHDKIEGIDIRYHLIPFNYETINANDKSFDIYLYDYLKDLTKFFLYKKNIGKIYYFNTTKSIFSENIINHFDYIKYKYIKFLYKNRNILKKSIIYIYQNNKNIFYKIDEILDDCMEWYCCYLIELYKYSKIIINAGLYHTSKINQYLINYYDYKVVENVGIVSMKDILNNNIDYSCKKISEDIINF